MRQGGLIARLNRYLGLTEGERDALDWMERREVSIPSGKHLMEEGEPNDRLYVVQQGWLHAASRLKTGGRQIFRFHYPGDLIGTSSIAWANASITLTAVSDCIVSEVPKVNLGRIFAAQPRIAALLYAMAAAENVAMNDRLASIGRMNATERLATLFLDMLARLRVTAGGVVTGFDMPLTQQDLGDAVALTKVHVSRTLGEMERAGMIERQGRRIRIVDEAALIAFTGFIDRYSTIETDWLPGAQAKAA